MSSDEEESEDDRSRAMMAQEKTGDDADDEEETEKESSKRKISKKKKKKKKKKDNDNDVEEPSDSKKEKKKKKKSSDKKGDELKEKTKKKSKDKKSKKDSEAPESPKKSKKKSKSKSKTDEMNSDELQGKSKKKDKKSKKKKAAKDVDAEPSTDRPITAPRPVVLDPVDYVDEDSDDAASKNSENQKMKELLAEWGGDDSSSSSSSWSSDENEDEDEANIDMRHMTKAELGLKDNALDHIVLGAPDFEEAMKEFEAMTGVRPSIGGALKGLGIITSRVGLENQAYIEIMAPDPNKPGPMGAQLMNMEPGSLIPIHFAIRQSNLGDLNDDYVPNELGYDPDRIQMFLPGVDGVLKKWELLFMHGHFHGGIVPYFVDWGECEHPLGSIAQAGALKSLQVACPPGSKVHELLSGIKEISVVDNSNGEGIEFSFSSPEGTIIFASDNPPGIKFPGAEEEGMFSDSAGLDTKKETSNEESENGDDAETSPENSAEEDKSETSEDDENEMEQEDEDESEMEEDDDDDSSDEESVVHVSDASDSS